MTVSSSSTAIPTDVDQACTLLHQALSEVGKVVVGQDRVLERVLTALLADGHVLLEGVPGLAKTLMVRTLAGVMGGSWRRVQFTPDLVPSDLTGNRVWRPDLSRFETEPGPVVCNFLLADEINRTSPKVQSALLEVMAERQVTVAGQTRVLDRPFLVLATANPIEDEGTFPLPEAQLDRFMMKIRVGYPDAADEVLVARQSLVTAPTVRQLLDVATLTALQTLTAEVHVDDDTVRYAVELVRATRDPHQPWGPQVAFGASPRGPIALLAAARARALLHGRAYVTADDVATLAPDVLAHRLVLTWQATADGVNATDIVDQAVAATRRPSGLTHRVRP
jgi:MoxR-like ATPase